ncbi:MAG: hypothetical protein KDA87_12550, partial [Planctomycetales bacterium]|nr:hypothetical protein [Planctomycetales bacterium]
STIADADGLGTFSYLWSTGATTPAIVLGDADVGSNISVTVSYTDGHGTYESLTSAAVGPVANVNNSPTGIPVISGVAQNGQTLTANTGGISDADGLGEFTFEWLRNDAVIAGASSNTYLLSDIDVGSQIRVQVSYVDNHGTTEGPITSDPTGTVTDVLSSGTKFFVVDQSRRRTFEYGADGSALDNSRLDKEDQGPRGIAASIDGSTLWVVDQKGEVFVYDSENNSLGSWEFEGVDKAEGIAVHGDDLWIVDRGEDRVYYFADGALRRSEKAEPTSSFSLVRGNRNPLGITTDGEHIWVVNNTKSTDKVFRYSIEGELEGSWQIDTANASPTGITIDPNDVNDVWIVDAISDHVYQYVGAAERTDGMQLADAQFPLAENNRNPQGIADPRPNSTGTASSFHPIDKSTISSSMSAARSHTPAARTSSDPQLTRDLVFAEFVQDRKTARRKLDSEFGWQSPDAQFESELVRTDAAAYGERDRLFSMIEDSDDH